jgi:glycosyltransferase involved in cell wall biosynthesis
MIQEPYSVIVTSYNAENTIENSLNSVLQMEPQPSEIILIDDVSTDSTQSIIRKFKENNDLFRFVINQKNSGQSASRNLGVTLAKNEILLFLDDDDECTPERAQIHLEHFRRGADLSFSSSKKRYSADYVVPIINSNFESTMLSAKLFVQHFVLGKSLPSSVAIFAPSSTLAVKKESFNRIYGFDENMRRLEDIELVCRSILLGLKTMWSDQVGVIRNHTSGEDKEGDRNFVGEMIVLSKNRNLISEYDYLIARNMIYIRKFYFDGRLNTKFRMIPIAIITLILNPAKLKPIFSRVIHDFRQRK